MKTDLLMDAVLRLTYKRPGDAQLRGLLKRARRLVLADEMAAFLYQLESEIFHIFEIPRGDRQRQNRWLRRVHGRLDDCRHFSRLPHEVTWVEYGLAAMLEREIAVRAERAQNSYVTPYDHPEKDLAHAIRSKSRIGWLLHQHPKIETAFQAEYFVAPMAGEGPKIGYARGAIVWQTDDDPLPWKTVTRLLPYGNSDANWSPCAYVAGIPQYERSNVGLRELPPRPCFHSWELGSDPLMNRGRMIWAFLATFNKVPICGEHKIQVSKGFVAGGGYHKFLTHSVVTINIPEKAGIRKIARAALSIIRRRAHEVRGHWRDDWRLPKGNKSIWIAEHTRGDASLGFVTHDYHVTHDNEDPSGVDEIKPIA